MDDVAARLREVVGAENVWSGEQIQADDTHDESLTAGPVVPLAVVRPRSTADVQAILRLADAERIPVVARGSGTGLSGGARPVTHGIVVAFDRMDRILEIDVDNQVAVMQPGVTLSQLDTALEPSGLLYPVYPGEMSASLGGNVATNAGGMRAIRYGVTRHHVLGVEAVLPGGETIRCGGKFVKSSSGYDLTQLIVGSEGTLALVTEVTVKLVGRLPHTTTVLAPFDGLEPVSRAVRAITAGHTTPLILEYIDAPAMAGITRAAGIELGVAEEIGATAAAYLVVVLENAHEDRLAGDLQTVAGLLADAEALEVYVLPPTAGADLITARERAFFVAKAAGANDIVDTVVPRAAVPEFLDTVAKLAADSGSYVSVCGHVGDGNVHLSVFQPDEARRDQLIRSVLRGAIALGGAISGEHGIGTEKQHHYLALEDPVRLALMRRIKAAFDPHGILGPGRLLGEGPPEA